MNISLPFRALILFLVIQSITPGPNNLTCLYLGASYGFRGARSYLFSSLFFLFLKALLCGFLNMALASTIPNMVQYLKWLGAAFMLYLAWMMMCSGWKAHNNYSIRSESGIRSGALLQLLNVKSWVGTLSTFGVYVIPYDTRLHSIIIVSCILVLIVFLASMIWLFFGKALHSLISRHKKVFGIVMGLSLVYCAISVLV